MSLQVLDPKSSVSITRLKQDVDSPGYRTFLIRNISASAVSNVIVKVQDAEIGSADATYLANRSVISMSYLKAAVATTSYLGVSPFAVLAKDSSDWEGILLDGWLQVSVDSFSWVQKITTTTLAAVTSKQYYTRFTRPTYATTLDFSFTLTNNSVVTMSSIVLTAAGSDLLSLDGVTYTASVTVGTLTAGSSDTIYLRSATIDASHINPAEIQILTGTANPITVQVDAIGLDRFYSTVEEVLRYLSDKIDVSIVTTDEEIRDLLKESSKAIDQATRRTFELTRITEYYDGSGQTKLVLNNYPVIAINSLTIKNYNNQTISTITPADSDFATRITIDYVNGLITLSQSAVIIAPVPLASMFYWPYSSYGMATMRASEFDYTYHFGKGASNIVVDYTFGFQVPPEPIRRACMKMVLIELLRKKGAVDTQGVASQSVAGATVTYNTSGRQSGSGPYASLIGDLQSDVDAPIAAWTMRRVGVV